jgi:hypothetical protein
MRGEMLGGVATVLATARSRVAVAVARLPNAPGADRFPASRVDLDLLSRESGLDATGACGAHGWYGCCPAGLPPG